MQFCTDNSRWGSHAVNKRPREKYTGHQQQNFPLDSLTPIYSNVQLKLTSLAGKLISESKLEWQTNKSTQQSIRKCNSTSPLLSLKRFSLSSIHKHVLYIKSLMNNHSLTFKSARTVREGLCGVASQHSCMDS